MALLVGVAGGLSACRDDAPEQPEPRPSAEVREVDLKEVVATAAQDERAEAVPDEAALRARLLPMLADFPTLSLEQIRMDSAPAEDGALTVAARVQVSVGENLYAREEAPEVFNEERRAMNDAMNLVMMPEAHYLLQVGAMSDEISDADREVRPLPENLRQAADELKSLAEQPIYHLRTPAHTVLELAAEMKVQRQDGQWVFQDLRFDTAPLRALVALMPESALPQGAAVVNEGFEARQRVLLREKIEAFNKAALPCIEAREEAARKRMLDARSRAEEASRAQAEAAAAKAAAREQWDKLCSGILKDGAQFSGEWKRGEAFGKLSLRVSKVQSFPESVQFTGVLSDPDMPQAELQVVGRLEQPQQADELVPLVVHIYNGRYDPDSPTAEAFDAKDALLRLRMAQDGSAQGVLTCAAWQDTPERDFLIILTHTPRKPAPKRAPVKR